MVIAWLTNSMEPTIGKPFLFMPTANEVWEAVRNAYSVFGECVSDFFLEDSTLE